MICPSATEQSEADAPSVQTPLLSPTKNDHANDDGKNDDPKFKFYADSSVLSIPREVAFGYLILLTGGDLKYLDLENSKNDNLQSNENSHGYVAPDCNNVAQADAITAGENDEKREQSASAPHPKRLQPPTMKVMDEATASLAYAAIVDGNLLHACFGLKTIGNGRIQLQLPSNPNCKNSSKWWERLCCLPNSSSSSFTQMILPSSSSSHRKILECNKNELQRLVDALREVRDWYFDHFHSSISLPHSSSKSSADSSSSESLPSSSLYDQIIQAYIRLFTIIMRYHDQVKLLSLSSSKSNSVYNRDAASPLSSASELQLPSAKKPKKSLMDILSCCFPFQNSKSASNTNTKLNSNSNSNSNRESISTSTNKDSIEKTIQLLQQSAMRDIQQAFLGLDIAIYKIMEDAEGKTDLISGVSSL